MLPCADCRPVGRGQTIGGMKTPAITLRPATPADADEIVALIRELAVFEKLEHMVVATAELLSSQLFGERPAAEVVMAELDGAVQGFALFFQNFSTFRCRPGLYLEDLYVRPAARGAGLGKALLRHLGFVGGAARLCPL